jgi:hypothetical protein
MKNHAELFCKGRAAFVANPCAGSRNAISSILSSPIGPPTNVRPIGKPASVNPQGTLTADRPAMFPSVNRDVGPVSVVLFVPELASPSVFKTTPAVAGPVRPVRLLP